MPVPGPDVASRGGTIRSCGDSTLLRSVVDWEPRRTWQESLADMWNRHDKIWRPAHELATFF